MNCIIKRNYGHKYCNILLYTILYSVLNKIHPPALITFFKPESQQVKQHYANDAMLNDSCQRLFIVSHVSTFVSRALLVKYSLKIDSDLFQFVKRPLVPSFLKKIFAACVSKDHLDSFNQHSCLSNRCSPDLNSTTVARQGRHTLYNVNKEVLFSKQTHNYILKFDI